MMRGLAGSLLAATLVATGAVARPASSASIQGSGLLAASGNSTAGGSATMGNSAGGDSFTAKWMGSRYVLGKDSQLSDRDAERLLQGPLDIAENRIRFGGSVCENVVFREKRVATAAYVAGVWGTTPKALGIREETLEVVSTNCDVFGFREYVRLPGGRLVFPYKGAFFFFDPFVFY